MTYYLINALIGAVIAMFISYVARTNLYVLAGLIPLFPTFTLFAYVSAYNTGGVTQLKEVIIFGFISVIAYLIYVAVMYFCVQQNIKFIYSIFISIFVWSIAAFNVYYLAKKFILIK